MSRHQYLLIRRLRVLLESRITPAGHLAMTVPWEHRGHCPPHECSPGCIEARELMALTEPYQPSAARPAPRPVTPLRRVVLRTRRPSSARPAAQQPRLWEVG